MSHQECKSCCNLHIHLAIHPQIHIFHHSYVHFNSSFTAHLTDTCGIRYTCSPTKPRKSLRTHILNPTGSDIFWLNFVILSIKILCLKSDFLQIGSISHLFWTFLRPLHSPIPGYVENLMSTKCRFLSKRPKGGKSVRYYDTMAEDEEN